MAENQKPRDPYQYERILRQKVQQTFNEQKNAGKPAGGQGGATPPPPVRDSAQELAQSIHELGRVIAQEVGGALGDTTREMGSALSGAARDVRKTAAQQKHQSQAQQAARRAGDALASRMNQAGSSLSSGLRDGLCIFGGTLAVICAVVAGLMALTALLSLAFFFDVIVLISLVFLLGVTAAFAFAARWAFSQPARRGRMRRYLAAMGSDRSKPSATR